MILIAANNTTERIIVKKYQGLKYVGLLIALSLPIILAYPAYATDGDVGKVENFIGELIGLGIKLALGISTLAIVVAGILYALNGGNPERLTKAKNTFIWACVGLALAIGAATISGIVNQISTKTLG